MGSHLETGMVDPPHHWGRQTHVSGQHHRLWRWMVSPVPSDRLLQHQPHTIQPQWSQTPHDTHFLHSPSADMTLGAWLDLHRDWKWGDCCLWVSHTQKITREYKSIIKSIGIKLNRLISNYISFLKVAIYTMADNTYDNSKIHLLTIWTWISSLETLAAEMSNAERCPAGKCLIVSPRTATRDPLPSITSTLHGEPEATRNYTSDK